MLFLLLMAGLSGGSLVAYAQSDANLWFKTVELVVFQQIVGAAIYLACFGWDLLRSRPVDGQ